MGKRPVSHQWMEEIFMHKNVDFPSLISVMNDVRLITGRHCDLHSPKGIDDSHITLCHESHRVSDVTTSKTKDWLRSENTTH